MNQIDDRKIYLLDIADRNYYNDRQQIIRVRHPTLTSVFFDFYIGDTIEYPNPGYHKVVLITDDDIIDNLGISENRLDLLPGINDKNGNLASIPFGICFLVSKRQKIKTVDPQSGSSGFSISKINMFDSNKIRVAIGPPIDKHYTNNNRNDQDSTRIGVFMNDDTVLVRSRGGSVTLGDEGIHFGGNIHWESTKHSKEIMQDNPFHGLIPQTIPTAVISIPQIPNLGMISQIADGSLKVIEITRKLSKVTKLLGT